MMKTYKKVPELIFCELLYCPNDCDHNTDGKCDKAPNNQRFTIRFCPEVEKRGTRKSKLVEHPWRLQDKETIKTKDGKVWMYDDKHCEWIHVGSPSEKLKKLLRDSVPLR